MFYEHDLGKSRQERERQRFFGHNSILSGWIDWWADKVYMPIMFAFMVLFITGLIGGTLWLALDSVSPTSVERRTFSLRVTDWYCTASHIEHHEARWIGGVYRAAYDSEECDQWSKR